MYFFSLLLHGGLSFISIEVVLSVLRSRFFFFFFFNNYFGTRGLCTVMQVHDSLYTKFKIGKVLTLQLPVDFLAFYPSDGEVVLLQSSNSIVLCNTRMWVLKMASQLWNKGKFLAGYSRYCVCTCKIYPSTCQIARWSLPATLILCLWCTSLFLHVFLHWVWPVIYVLQWNQEKRPVNDDNLIV